jgi:hypothetical protein
MIYQRIICYSYELVTMKAAAGNNLESDGVLGGSIDV